MKIQGSTNHVENHTFETVAKHIIDEIVSHAIWDKIGTLTGIGHKAVSFLGSLLFFQKLEGGDEYLIPKSVSEPIATWDIKSAINRFSSESKVHQICQDI